MLPSDQIQEIAGQVLLQSFTSYIQDTPAVDLANNYIDLTGELPDSDFDRVVDAINTAQLHATVGWKEPAPEVVG